MKGFSPYLSRRAAVLGALSATAMTPSLLNANAPAGFYVPAEEEPHQCTFMQWPVSREVYTDPVFLERVQNTIAEIANTISNFEPVIMLADASDHSQLRPYLRREVALWDIPTEDLWCRDSGPIFTRNAAGDLALTRIAFNGWGRKQVHLRDGQIAMRIAKQMGLHIYESGLIGEAGGVEQDGHGLLMAHESSWVTPSRNPELSRQQIETRLLNAYGADRMIWSKGVQDQDITDYHIDSLARFSGPGRVLMTLPDHPDRRDHFHRAALETYNVLKAADLEIEVIPEPAYRRVNSDEFVASYVNYYVCNGAVIASQFGDHETDQIAAQILARHYPDREIVMLNVDPLGELGGGIHCATQQMPAT